MSTAVLPSLKGLGFEVTRTPIWDTQVQTAISGKEVRIALQTYPRWMWELPYDFLRSDSTNHEFQDLIGFFNQRQGQADTFLYQDADDNSVTGQDIGTGDATTTTFQLIRAFGGFIEPILAPNTGGTIHIYLNGTLQVSGYTVSGWGTATPGVVTFTSAPGSGVAITADFTYYWPVRMSDDKLQTSLFIKGFYSVKKFAFISVKG